MNFEAIQVAIFDWLHGALNVEFFDANGIPTYYNEGSKFAIPVIRANDDQVRPNSLFVEFNFLTGLVKQGAQDETLYTATGDKFVSRGQRDITVTVTTIGDGAVETLAKIQNSLNLSYIHDILRTAGLSVRGDEAIADQSVFQETSTEERAVLDVIFGLVVTTDDPISRIEHIELKNNLPGGATKVVDII